MPLEWKDAAKALPPKDAYEMALVVARDVYGDPYLTFGWYDHYQQMWRGRYGRLAGVSHWMDLPAPPQGVTYRHIGEPKKMMTDPYAPGPQQDDRPGCFETALRLLLVLLVLIMSRWAPAQAQTEEEPPPISSTACCWFYLPVVTNPCTGEVCASAAQTSGGAQAADMK